MVNVAQQRWLDSIRWQTEFYQRSSRVRRKDTEFEWDAYERGLSRRLPYIARLAKQVLYNLGYIKNPPISLDWLCGNADVLWNTREILADDLSRLLYDSVLVMRMSDYRRFYFPRIDFDLLLEITAENSFSMAGFPSDYLGVPLRIFDVRLINRETPQSLRIVTRAIQLQLVNNYRQYLIRRDNNDISPRLGEVVYDCGACIGEISLLFAGMVSQGGEVHMFDPMPLHMKFCRMQATLNPHLDTELYFNTCAVGGRTHEGSQLPMDSTKIAPNAVVGDKFACTTLDDYAKKQTRRVDFVKMDIEGAEMEALCGAAEIVAAFKPRMAISGYHKPEDLWEIPQKLKSLNPDYRITFGHHTPISWESVFYAVDPTDLDARFR